MMGAEVGRAAGQDHLGPWRDHASQLPEAVYGCARVGSLGHLVEPIEKEE